MRDDAMTYAFLDQSFPFAHAISESIFRSKFLARIHLTVQKSFHHIKVGNLNIKHKELREKNRGQEQSKDLAL
jgi:hypothetical protein